MDGRDGGGGVLEMGGCGGMGGVVSESEVVEGEVEEE